MTGTGMTDLNQVWTDHKLVNTTQKLQFGVMVTEKSFWDKKIATFCRITHIPPHEFYCTV